MEGSRRLSLHGLRQSERTGATRALCLPFAFSKEFGTFAADLTPAFDTGVTMVLPVQAPSVHSTAPFTCNVWQARGKHTTSARSSGRLDRSAPYRGQHPTVQCQHGVLLAGITSLLPSPLRSPRGRSVAALRAQRSRTQSQRMFHQPTACNPW